MLESYGAMVGCFGITTLLCWKDNLSPGRLEPRCRAPLTCCQNISLLDRSTLKCKGDNQRTPQSDVSGKTDFSKDLRSGTALGMTGARRFRKFQVDSMSFSRDSISFTELIEPENTKTAGIDRTLLFSHDESQDE
jgi:hypothetical protein